MKSQKSKCGIINSAFLLTSILFSSMSAMAASSYEVTSGNDSGSGTLREALASGATVIVINGSVSNIIVTDTLYYEGEAALKIIGSGQLVDGSGHSNTLFAITKGADVEVSNLDFEGDGSFDVFNPGGGKGIYVDVPLSRVGIVSLSLTNVAITNVGLHGIHVDDCTLEPCGAGSGGGGDGSAASIHVSLKNVTVDNAGNGGFDSDGVRVDDRGDGDIVFSAVGSTFINIGADGVELDEGNDGDVDVNVRNSVFEFNGGYCAGILEPLSFPEPTGCVENDDGELVLDLDDGFDVDEAGAGSIYIDIKNTTISDNLDEGLDIDEQDAGGINIDLITIETLRNGDEGIKVSEEDNDNLPDVEGGDVVANLRHVTADDNGDNGIQIEQAHGGDINVTVNSTDTMGNAKEGLKVGQDGSGGGSLMVRGSNITDGIDSDVPLL